MNDWEKRRDELALDHAGLSAEDEQASFNKTCFIMKDSFDSGFTAGRADALKHLGEVPEVKALVEALKEIKDDSQNYHIAGNEYFNEFDPYGIADRALANFKATQGDE